MSSDGPAEPTEPTAASPNDAIAAEIDVSAKEWIAVKVAEELQNIKETNVKISSYNILNCGIVPNFERRLPRAVNRIELDTTDDPKKISQVMVSPPVEYPHRPDFYYVNLILITNHDPSAASQDDQYVLAPYLFQDPLQARRPEIVSEGRKQPSKMVSLRNDLKEFLFINKNGLRARLSIDSYRSV